MLAVNKCRSISYLNAAKACTRGIKSIRAIRAIRDGLRDVGVTSYVLSKCYF